MPTFMQSLANNPSGSSGIYGSSGNQGPGTGEALDLVNQLKDRELRDFKDKANFMSDLSLRQEARMRSLFDPEQQGSQGQQNTHGMNTVVQDPNQMTGYEKGELGVKQQQLGVERQKIAQSGKLGQEAIDVRTAQEKLNQQKSDQINASKQADMERKINEANQKIELAQAALQQRTDNAEAQLKQHKDLAAAVEERHKLELDKRDHQFEITKEQHAQQIKILEERVKQGSGSQKTEYVKDDKGNVIQSRETTNQRGQTTALTPKKKSDGSYDIYNGDQPLYNIPGDKLDDWKANHGNRVPPKPEGEQ